MKRLFLGLFSFFLFTFAACGLKETELPPYGQGNKEEFEQFLTEISPQEEPWTEEEIQTYESYIQPKEFEHVFRKEEIQALTESKKNPKTVTAQQAAEDVTLIFELLSYAYGGYCVFADSGRHFSRIGIYGKSQDGGFVEAFVEFNISGDPGQTLLYYDKSTVHHHT